MATQKKRLVSIRSFMDHEARTARFWAHDNIKDADVNGFNINFDMRKLNPGLVNVAALTGCVDSIRDAGALPAGSTLKAKFDAMRERADYLASGAGEWAQRGRGISEGSLLFRALSCAYERKSPDEIRKHIEGKKQKAEKAREANADAPAWNTLVAAMLRSDKLRSIVEELRAADAKGVDTEGLFDELDSE